MVHCNACDKSIFYADDNDIAHEETFYPEPDTIAIFTICKKCWKNMTPDQLDNFRKRYIEILYSKS